MKIQSTMHARAVLQTVAQDLRVQAKTAKSLAGPAPTRAEQARIETLELVVKQLGEIEVLT